MTLPAKALTVLLALRNDLISQQDSSDVIITPNKPVEIKRKHQKSTVRMRHARRPNAYQKMCQRGDRW